MPKEEKQNVFWGERIAKEVLEKFPDQKVYTCAAGISPSGAVHFGNFRDFITAYVGAEALNSLGKKTRLIYSWDDFDRFRKVPAGLPESFEEHIGKPLSSVPDKDDCHESYALHHEEEYEKSLNELGFDVEYLYQTKKYKNGDYDDHIITALKGRKEIAKILLSLMSDKGKASRGIDEEKFIEEYFPISVYSEHTGKDNTRITSYDGESTVTYMCYDTKKEEKIDIKKTHIVKLIWKADWAMRQMYERVVFEPSGHDHQSPGGGVDGARNIIEKIYKTISPVTPEYKFVGLQGQGSKMSGSKGNSITVGELLSIYQPSLLKWIYLRKTPNQSFSVALNTEIYRQYDEFDRTVKASLKKELTDIELRQVEISFKGTKEIQFEKPLPMRLAVSLGQIVQWNADKIKEILLALDMQYDIDSIDVRLPLAKAWLETYNPEEMIALREEQNTEYWNKMSDKAKDYVRELKQLLDSGMEDIKELEKHVYAIPKDDTLSQKENAPLQRAFFKDVYNLLIGKDTGPRLSTFLWAVESKKIIKLLSL